MSWNYMADGQMSLFDLDTWCGKTSTEHSAATEERTSVPSLKKPLKLPKGMPLFLDLRTDRSCRQADISWEIGGALPGVDTMLSIGECRRDERESVWLPISTGSPRHSSYLILDTGEKPNTPRPSKLSEILETNPDPKYNLSAKACQGILRRAESRGKELPEQLRAALERQSVSKSELENQGGGKGILIQNERTGALSTLTNQSICAGVVSKGNGEALYSGECRGGGGEQYVMQEPISFTTEMTPKTDKNGVGFSLRSRDKKDPQGVVCIEGNGTRDSHRGDGFTESETMYTLNTVEQHAVCIGNGQLAQLTESDVVGTLNCMHDQQAVITYGLDRASFNQGQNAKFDFSVEEEVAPTVVSRGPGGGTHETVRALCARDWKGVGSQYVDDGKVIVQQKIDQ